MQPSSFFFIGAPDSQQQQQSSFNTAPQANANSSAGAGSSTSTDLFAARPPVGAFAAPTASANSNHNGPGFSMTLSQQNHENNSTFAQQNGSGGNSVWRRGFGETDPATAAAQDASHIGGGQARPARAFGHPYARGGAAGAGAAGNGNPRGGRPRQAGSRDQRLFKNRSRDFRNQPAQENSAAAAPDAQPSSESALQSAFSKSRPSKRVSFASASDTLASAFAKPATSRISFGINSAFGNSAMGASDSSEPEFDSELDQDSLIMDQDPYTKPAATAMQSTADSAFAQKAVSSWGNMSASFGGVGNKLGSNGSMTQPLNTTPPGLKRSQNGRGSSDDMLANSVLDYDAEPQAAPFSRQDRANRFSGITSGSADSSAAGTNDRHPYLVMKDQRDDLRKMYIQKGKMADPNGRYKLGEAPDLVAECTDMCPEFERYEREYQKGLDRFERLNPDDASSAMPVVDHQRAVKRYRRSAAGDPPPLPCDVRPPATLLRTLDYLLNDIVAVHGIEASYAFVRDRARAIRNDLTLQNYRGAEAIELHERIARYHILCSHALCGVSGVSMQQEHEQLRKTLQSLIEYYQEMATRGQRMPNEPEFQAYYILTHMWSNDIVSRAELELPRHVFLDSRVQLALHLRFLIARTNEEFVKDRPSVDGSLNDYVGFFRLLRSTRVPYLFACCMHMVFVDIRRGALKAMQQAYYYIPEHARSGIRVSDLVDMLAFEDVDEAIETLQYYEIPVVEATEAGVSSDLMVEPTDASNAGDARGEMIACIGKLRNRNAQGRAVMSRARFDETKRASLQARKSIRVIEAKRQGISDVDIIDGRSTGTRAVPPLSESKTFFRLAPSTDTKSTSSATSFQAQAVTQSSKPPNRLSVYAQPFVPSGWPPSSSGASQQGLLTASTPPAQSSTQAKPGTLFGSQNAPATTTPASTIKPFFGESWSQGPDQPAIKPFFGSFSSQPPDSSSISSAPKAPSVQESSSTAFNFKSPFQKSAAAPTPSSAPAQTKHPVVSMFSPPSMAASQPPSFSMPAAIVKPPSSSTQVFPTTSPSIQATSSAQSTQPAVPTLVTKEIPKPKSVPQHIVSGASTTVFDQILDAIVSETAQACLAREQYIHNLVFTVENLTESLVDEVSDLMVVDVVHDLFEELKWERESMVFGWLRWRYVCKRSHKRKREALERSARLREIVAAANVGASSNKAMVDDMLSMTVDAAKRHEQWWTPISIRDTVVAPVLQNPSTKHLRVADVKIVVSIPRGDASVQSDPAWLPVQWLRSKFDRMDSLSMNGDNQHATAVTTLIDETHVAQTRNWSDGRCVRVLVQSDNESSFVPPSTATKTISHKVEQLHNSDARLSGATAAIFQVDPLGSKNISLDGLSVFWIRESHRLNAFVAGLPSGCPVPLLIVFSPSDALKPDAFIRESRSRLGIDEYLSRGLFTTVLFFEIDMTTFRFDDASARAQLQSAFWSILSACTVLPPATLRSHVMQDPSMSQLVRHLENAAMLIEMSIPGQNRTHPSIVVSATRTFAEMYNAFVDAIVSVVAEPVLVNMSYPSRERVEQLHQTHEQRDKRLRSGSVSEVDLPPLAWNAPATLEQHKAFAQKVRMRVPDDLALHTSRTGYSMAPGSMELYEHTTVFFEQLVAACGNDLERQPKSTQDIDRAQKQIRRQSLIETESVVSSDADSLSRRRSSSISLSRSTVASFPLANTLLAVATFLFADFAAYLDGDDIDTTCIPYLASTIQPAMNTFVDQMGALFDEWRASLDLSSVRSVTKASEASASIASTSPKSSKPPDYMARYSGIDTSKSIGAHTRKRSDTEDESASVTDVACHPPVRKMPRQNGDGSVHDDGTSNTSGSVRRSMTNSALREAMASAQAELERSRKLMAMLDS